MTKFTDEEIILAIKREIGFRERVYPSFVAKKKMKQEAADYQLAVFRALLERFGGLVNMTTPTDE